MAAPLVTQLVTLVGQAYATRMGGNLVQSVPLGPEHPFWIPLQGALQSFSDSDLASASLAQHVSFVPASDRDGLAALLSAALNNVKQSSTQHTPTPEAAYACFKAMLGVHAELHKLYASQGGDGGYKNAFLNGMVVAVCRHLVGLSAVAASLSTLPIREQASPRGIKDATRQAIEKSLQVSACHMADGEWHAEVNKPESVGDIMWQLANILWRLYAQRKLHTQATDLSKIFAGIQPPEGKRLAARGHCIPLTAVAESYYWRGRIGVVLLEMRMAHRWLEKAWDMCPEEAWQQRRAILIRLIPVSLLLGKLPHSSVLQHYSLEAEFTPFIQAFKTGNVPQWRRLLSERQEWLRARSIWLIWFERGEILVWRNLFRKALAIYYQTPGATKHRAPTWVFLAAAQRAFAGSGELEDGTLALEDIVCTIASLIDQGLIMGILTYSQRQMVLKPSLDGFGGFPRVSQVVPRRVDAVA